MIKSFNFLTINGRIVTVDIDVQPLELNLNALHDSLVGILDPEYIDITLQRTHATVSKFADVQALEANMEQANHHIANRNKKTFE